MSHTPMAISYEVDEDGFPVAHHDCLGSLDDDEFHERFIEDPKDIKIRTLAEQVRELKSQLEQQYQSNLRTYSKCSSILSQHLQVNSRTSIETKPVYSFGQRGAHYVSSPVSYFSGLNGPAGNTGHQHGDTELEALALAMARYIGLSSKGDAREARAA